MRASIAIDQASSQNGGLTCQANAHSQFQSGGGGEVLEYLDGVFQIGVFIIWLGGVAKGGYKGGLGKGWREVGEGLDRGWRRVGEGLEKGLGKGWRGVGEGLGKS